MTTVRRKPPESPTATLSSTHGAPQSVVVAHRKHALVARLGEMLAIQVEALVSKWSKASRLLAEDRPTFAIWAPEGSAIHLEEDVRLIAK